MDDEIGFRHLADLGSFAVVAGTLVGYLPALAAALSIIWTVIRIVDWYSTKRN